MSPRPSLRLERTLWGDEVRFIAGVDEVGRGPLAGPVAAGAVVFPPNVRAGGRYRFLKHVDDSKKLTHEQRVELAEYIWEHALSAAVGFVSVEMIDRIGIAEASRQAWLSAIGDLAMRPDHLLLDAFPLKACNISQTNIIGGDGISVSIGAASIIAKVARDRVMEAHEALHPGYGFASNKGYYTQEHVRAIRALGPCDLHRRSFSPVKEILLGEQLPFWPEELPVTALVLTPLLLAAPALEG